MFRMRSFQKSGHSRSRITSSFPITSKRINEQQIAEYLRLLRALPIRTESQPLWTNVELESLARRWDLTAYDASYLALALRKKIPLATCDEFLKRKALDEGIQILRVETTK